MGLFSLLKGASATPSEVTRGDMLAEAIEVVVNKVRKESSDFQSIVGAAYSEKRAEIVAQHFSTDQQDALGQALRAAASKLLKEQVEGSHEQACAFGLWFAAAWLESGASQSARARIAHDLLGQLATGA